MNDPTRKFAVLSIAGKLRAKINKNIEMIVPNIDPTNPVTSSAVRFLNSNIPFKNVRFIESITKTVTTILSYYVE